MKVQLPSLTGTDFDAFALLFDLYRRWPEGWLLAGAQMVICHLAEHGIQRPTRTRDTDVLVDVRTLSPATVVDWLMQRGFEPGAATGGTSADDVVHRFHLGELAIDVLAIDRAGERADLTTTPPARTIEVAGGRQAVNRTITADVTIGDLEGRLLIPDWLGALVLKARAAAEYPDSRDKHLTDALMLAALPVDLASFRRTITAKERRRVRDLAALLDRRTQPWRVVEATSLNPADARAAMTLLDR